MRVISGSAKGYGLKSPRHLGLRPTPSRVKEAIFSSLASHIPGARVLELFAGTGAFGIETLSRGAEMVTFVEKDHRAAKIIEDNLQKTHLKEKARILRTDIRQAVEWLSRDKAQFDLIFADPPYDHGPSEATKKKGPPAVRWVKVLLESEELSSLLCEKSILLLEYFKKDIPPESKFFTPGREFRFGDTIVQVYQRRARGL